MQLVLANFDSHIFSSPIVGIDFIVLFFIFGENGEIKMRIDLIFNLSLLVAISALSGLVARTKPIETTTGKILQGLLFAFAAIVGMLKPIFIEPGLILDGRTIVISLCTLFFGPIAGGITALFAGTVRIYLGGVGLPMGIGAIIESFVVGWVFHSLLQKKGLVWFTNFKLYLFGLLVHIIMTIFIFTFPSIDANLVISQVFWAFILVYPLITLIIGFIIKGQIISQNYLNELAKRESVFRTILYSIGDAVITADENGNVLHMNKIAEELTGWDEYSAIGKNILEVFHIVNEFTEKPAENPLPKVLKKGVIKKLANHTVLISRKGEKYPIADSAAPIFDDTGKIRGVVITFRDQTEERRTQKIIEEAELRYRQFVQSSIAGIWRFDLNPPVPITLPTEEQIRLILEGGWLAECNDVFAQMYGYKKAEEIVGIKLTDVFLADNPTNLEVLKYFIENGYKIENAESLEVDKFGNRKYFLNSYVGIIDNGNLIRAWGMQTDITEKKRLEEELKESEAKFRIITENSLAGIYLLIDNKIEYANKSLLDMLGYTADEAFGMPVVNILPPDEQGKVLENIRRRVTGEIEDLRYETCLIRKDSSKIFVEVHGRRIEYKGKIGILGTLINITEKKRYQEELEEKENRLRSIFQASPDLYFIIDKDGRYLYVAPVNNDLIFIPHEEIMGKTFAEIFEPEMAKFFMDAVRQSLSTKSKVTIEYPLEIRGNHYWFLADIVPYKEDQILSIVHDITQRKKLEEQIRISEETFRGIFNQILEAIYIQDENGVFLDVNDGAVRMYGYPKEFFIGKTPEQLSAPGKNNLEDITQFITKAFNGEIQKFEFWGQRSNGEIFPKDVRLYPGTYFGKKVIIAIAEDITPRKRSETLSEIEYNIANSLTKSKNLEEFVSTIRIQLGKLFDTTNFFIAFYNENQHLLTSPFEWDEKADAPPTWSAEKSLTGLVVKEKKSYLLKQNDIINLLEQGVVELIGSLPQCWMGTPLIVQDKSMGAIVIQDYHNPNAYTFNDLRLFEQIAIEIASYILKKKDEEELRKLSQAIINSPIAIVITDSDGNIEYVNPKFTNLTGYTFDEAVGKTPRILKSGYHNLEFYQNLWVTIKSGKIWEGEFQNKKKNGELYWDLSTISPVLNDKGIITHFVGMKQDMTEIKQMMENLTLAKEKAEESEKLKTAFLANISHEVRSPLNAIIGFSQFLSQGKIQPAEIKQFGNIIRRRGLDLLRLFNDLIDISHLETKHLLLSYTSAKANSILYDLFTTFSASEELKSKKLELKIGKTFSEDFTCTTDFFRVQQILSNLINNAIKFTQRGYVEFGGYLRDDGIMEFYVKDTGIGIPENKLNQIFERFYKLETNFLTIEHEGLGLGLSISKGLVDLLGGQIWVESKILKGSTFFFTIPPKESRQMQVETETSITPEPTKDEKDYAFMIVEDDYSNYLLLRKLLEQNFKCNIIYAKNGKEAIEKFQSNSRIDLVLLDIQLPLLDGFGVFGELRKLNPNQKIIALTAYAYPEDRSRFLRFGFDDYISKPIDFSSTIEIINKLLKK